jgi:hypothetical protein
MGRDSLLALRQSNSPGAHWQGKGNVFRQLHCRLDGGNAAAPGPKELQPQPILIGGLRSKQPKLQPEDKRQSELENAGTRKM